MYLQGYNSVNNNNTTELQETSKSLRDDPLSRGFDWLALACSFSLWRLCLRLRLIRIHLGNDQNNISK